MRNLALALLLVVVPGCAGQLHEFQRYHEIYPARLIRAGLDTSPLPRTDNQDEITYRFEGETRTLAQFIERTQVAALLLAGDGAIRYEYYADGTDPATLFTSWSVAKSVTATLIGFARADGLIRSIDDPVTDYLPALEQTAYRGVTIRQVLQMSSGVAFDEDYDNPDSDFWTFMNDWARQGRANEYLLTQQEQAAEPGTRFNYNTSETQVLGWLLREVTGSTVADYLSRKIWQPAGMAHNGYWLLDATDGMEVTGIGISATLRDYARFGLLYADGDALPPGWVSEATRPSDPQVANGALYEGMDLGYQYQWWSFPDGSFEAQGIHGQFIYVHPEQKVVMVVLSAWDEPWVFDHEKELYAVFASLTGG